MHEITIGGARTIVGKYLGSSARWHFQAWTCVGKRRGLLATNAMGKRLGKPKLVFLWGQSGTCTGVFIGGETYLVDRPFESVIRIFDWVVAED